MKERKEKIIDFYKIGAIIEKNFIVMTRDKVRIIPLLIFPVVMILVFGYISGNIPKHISTAIIAYDNSPLSLEIQEEIAKSEIFAIRHVVSTEDEGKQLLDKGEVKVLIEIPPNMQSDVDNNIQTKITVIIDESDSSIGGTAKTTMNSIVNGISHKISMQKLTRYQQSVDRAAIQLKYNSMQQTNFYKTILEKTDAAENSLTESQKLTRAYIELLQAATVNPVPFVVQTQKGQNMSYNNTYLFRQQSSLSIESQIATLQKSSALNSIADTNVKAVSAIAAQANTELEKSQDYESYNKQVVLPFAEIEMFVHSDANDMLQPVLYAEKPAYGTGKRAVDFLIPAIIALTIFQGAVMGMGRSVAGEKRDGSLTRVFLTPTSNATIIIGTLGFYVIFELLRSVFIIGVSMIFFNIQIEGNLLLIGLILLMYAGVSTSIGMVLSSMVKTEQQFMAMAMLVSMPTMFLSGALFPLQAMPKFMQTLASFLPVTYGGDALRGVMIKGFSINMVAFPLFILGLFLVSALAIVFMVYKRDIE